MPEHYYAGSPQSPGDAGGTYQPDFKIATAGMLIDSEMSAQTQRPIVRMVGSSTEQDLHRDTMTVTALHDMMTRAPQGLLIWLNHDYSVPDSVFGSLTDQPIIIQKNGVVDLHLSVDVELDNPAAAKTYQLIQNHRRLGCSVGCSVEDYELRDSGLSKGTPGWDVPLVYITHVRPVEWSVVGVPANQRSWVENAINGLWTRALFEPGQEEVALRLAPIVKGLFPNEFRKKVNKLENVDFQTTLKSVQARPAPSERLVWRPTSRSFAFMHDANDEVGIAVAPDKAASVIEGLRAKFYENKEFAPPVAPETPASAPDSFQWTPEGRKQFMDAIVSEVKSQLFVGAKEPLNAKDGDVWIATGTSYPTVIRNADDAISGATDDLGDLIQKAADDAAKQAQEARSQKYHIGIKEGGNVTKPAQFANVPDDAYGDPVNYRYPMIDKAHADDAASRWGDASNRSQYTAEEQAIIGKRIEARQHHFGETQSDSKEKSNMPHLIKSDVLADGRIVEYFSDASRKMTTITKSEDGTNNVETIVLPDDYVIETKSAEEPAGDEPAGEEPAVEEPAVEEPAAEEPAAEEPAEPAGEEPAGEEPAEEPVVEVQKSLDPAQTALLASYNTLGKALGLTEIVDLWAAKTAVSSDVSAEVKSLAKVIDDAADRLLAALGVPDIDVDGGTAKSADDLVTKAGAALSAANRGKIKGAHDVLAEMAGGLHCAAFMNDQAVAADDDTKKAAEPEIVAQVTIDDAKLAEAIDASVAKHLGALIERFDTLAKSFEGIQTKALADEIAAAKTELALTRKSLADTKADADAVNASLTELQNTGMGRPTKTFAGRDVPAGKLAGITAPSDASITPEVPQVDTLEEALAIVPIERLPGVGQVRVWAKGLGVNVRPPLVAEQMVGMTTHDVSSYYNGGEARVPVMRDGQGNIIG